MDCGCYSFHFIQGQDIVVVGAEATEDIVRISFITLIFTNIQPQIFTSGGVHRKSKGGFIGLNGLGKIFQVGNIFGPI